MMKPLFFEVRAQFLIRFEGMEQLDDKAVLLRVIDMIHDGADLHGIDAKRIVIEYASE